MLFNRFEQNEHWLNIAKEGWAFIEKYAISPSGDFYFSVDQEGKPLIQPYNIFSDCFGAMAAAQLGKATGDDGLGAKAVQIFNRILERAENPKGIWEKSTGNRAIKGFALPMILSNLVLELEDFLSGELIDTSLDRCITEILDHFWNPLSGWIHEYIGIDNTIMDTFEGRLVNPGHGIEAMWFLMDIARRRNDPKLAEKCIEILLALLEKGWDHEYGGIYYFLDAQAKPPLQLEWDQKLWWVHLESLLALAKAYAWQPEEKIWAWFKKVHDYTWSHFPDEAYGEWWAYLKRNGEVLIPLKGGKWKGCFHVPRALFQIGQSLGEIA